MHCICMNILQSVYFILSLNKAADRQAITYKKHESAVKLE